MLWLLRKDIQAVCRPLLENFPNLYTFSGGMSLLYYKVCLNESVLFTVYYNVILLYLMKMYTTMRNIYKNLYGLYLAQFFHISLRTTCRLL